MENRLKAYCDKMAEIIQSQAAREVRVCGAETAETMF